MFYYLSVCNDRLMLLPVVVFANDSAELCKFCISSARFAMLKTL